MLSLLDLFRTSVEQVFMDGPVVEMLLKEVNSKNIKTLLYYLNQNRKLGGLESTLHDYSIAPLYDDKKVNGPLFPKLKQFTVTSNVSISQKQVTFRPFRHNS